MICSDEIETEARIYDLGLNVPRITPKDLDNAIIGEDYYVFPDSTVTICLLRLKNGFKVVGESATVSDAGFDAQIGRDLAKKNARDKLWSLMGFALRDRLYQMG